MSDTGFNIRVFTTDDLERVMEINKTCLPENYTTYFYRDLYKRYPQTFLVAEVDGEIQGYVLCRIEKGFSKVGRMLPVRLCHIVSIAVMVEYRRMGMGSDLLVEAMKQSVKHYDASECYLEVRVSNDAAVELYNKLEFLKVKRNYGYYMDGEDAWMMAVDIRNIDH